MEIRAVICVSALFIQSITAQCYDRLASGAYKSSQASSTPSQASSMPSQASSTLSQASSASDQPIASYTKTFTTDGSPLTITYSCPIASSGVSLLSELGMQGQLAVTGSMPFLGAVQMEGTLPSSGTATVNYGCGDTVLINQEQGNPCGPNAKAASGLTLSDLANVR